MLRIYNSPKYIPLEVQSLIECGSRYSDYLRGCIGGSMESAFGYVKQKGLVSEKSNPYLFEESIYIFGRDYNCNDNKNGQFKISEFMATTENSCKSIIEAL